MQGKKGSNEIWKFTKSGQLLNKALNDNWLFGESIWEMKNNYIISKSTPITVHGPIQYYICKSSLGKMLIIIVYKVPTPKKPSILLMKKFE